MQANVSCLLKWELQCPGALVCWVPPEHAAIANPARHAYPHLVEKGPMLAGQPCPPLATSAEVAPRCTCTRTRTCLQIHHGVIYQFVSFERGAGVGVGNCGRQLSLGVRSPVPLRLQCCFLPPLSLRPPFPSMFQTNRRRACPRASMRACNHACPMLPYNPHESPPHRTIIFCCLRQGVTHAHHPQFHLYPTLAMPVHGAGQL